MTEGGPQVTSPLSDVEGDVSCINTARGRAKERSMAGPPCIILALTDAADVCRHARSRGTVIEVREPAAKDLIGPTGQVRATFMPRPDHSDTKP